MNKILILTVLLILRITVYGQQSRTGAIAAALYSAEDVIRISSCMSAIVPEAYNSQEYLDLSPTAMTLAKAAITPNAINNSTITSSVYINVFKVAHKTVAGWMNSGSSAPTGALFSDTVTSETTLSLSRYAGYGISASAAGTAIHTYNFTDISLSSIVPVRHYQSRLPNFRIKCSQLSYYGIEC